MKQGKTISLSIAITATLLLGSATFSIAADQLRLHSQDRLRDGTCTTVTGSQTQDRTRDRFQSGTNSDSLQQRSRTQTNMRTRQAGPRAK